MCDKLDEEDRKTEAYRDMMGKVEQQKKCQEEMAGELTAVQVRDRHMWCVSDRTENNVWFDRTKSRSCKPLKKIC